MKDTQCNLRFWPKLVTLKGLKHLLLMFKTHCLHIGSVSMMPKMVFMLAAHSVLKQSLDFSRQKTCSSLSFSSNLHAGDPHVILSSSAMVPAFVVIKSSSCSLRRVHPARHWKQAVWARVPCHLQHHAKCTFKANFYSS